MNTEIFVLAFYTVFLSCSNVNCQSADANIINGNSKECVAKEEIGQLLKDLLTNVKKELHKTKNELKEEMKSWMCNYTNKPNEAEKSSKSISSNNQCADAMFFKGGNIIDHAKYWPRHDGSSDEQSGDGLAMNIDELTSCFWIKMKNCNGQPTVLSYAVPRRDNEWIIYIETTLRLYLKNKVATPIGVGYDSKVSISDGKWHHVCVTWDSRDGVLEVFKDGVLTKRTTGLMKQSYIEKYGQWIIGQDQDNFGGGFEKNDAFEGALTEVHVWSKVLNQTEISTLANHCGTSLKGDHVAYSDFVTSGDVQKFKPSCCN